MSISSMTGCGQGQATLHGYLVRVELSAVNRKQLDITLQIPRAYGALESRVQDEVRPKIHRGRIHVAIQVEVSSTRQLHTVHVDEPLADRYVARLRKVAKSMNLPDALSSSDLLRLPGVVTQEFAADNLDHVWAAVKKALRPALKQLIAMRLREGENLRKELESHLKKFKQCHQRLEKYAPSAADAYRKRLLARLKTSGISVGKQDDRLLKEIAIFSDRCDIQEEVARLQSHFQQVEHSLQSKEPVGRVLDFLSQEMLREVNTIGSKAQDIRITKQVIQFKSVLEQFREQVQNIE